MNTGSNTTDWYDGSNNGCGDDGGDGDNGAQWSSTRRVTDLYVTRGCLRRARAASARVTSTRCNDGCVDRCSCTGAARRAALRRVALHRDSARATRSSQPLLHFFPFPKPFASPASRLAGGRPDATATRFICNSGRPLQHFSICELDMLWDGDKDWINTFKIIDLLI